MTNTPDPLDVDFDALEAMDLTTVTFHGATAIDAAFGDDDPEFARRVAEGVAQRAADHNILAALRTAAGLSQEQVAEAWGRAQPHVSRIERSDLTRASLGTITEFVEALGGTLHLVAQLHGARVEFPLTVPVAVVAERDIRRAG